MLNESNLDNCNPYRCADDHFCEVGPLDSDRDGFIARQCEPVLEKQDCNDATDIDFPGADEICDARDNDCDGKVDEDVLEQGWSSNVVAAMRGACCCDVCKHSWATTAVSACPMRRTGSSWATNPTSTPLR